MAFFCANLNDNDIEHLNIYTNCTNLIIDLVSVPDETEVSVYDVRTKVI